jgi:CDP-diacylglycerol--glycerol-3-phosphate 3-phosphatidyltransferase
MKPNIQKASDKVLTASNAVSFFRVLLVIPVWITISKGLKEWTLTIMVVAYLSDLLDGFVARMTGTVSEWGKVIDPLADKVFVIVAIIALYVNGYVETWYFLLIILRDALIFFVGIWAQRKLGVVLPSNWWGKAAVFTISLTLFLSVIGVSYHVLLLSVVASSGLAIVSVVVYGIRLSSLLRVK